MFSVYFNSKTNTFVICKWYDDTVKFSLNSCTVQQKLMVRAI